MEIQESNKIIMKFMEMRILKIDNKFSLSKDHLQVFKNTEEGAINSFSEYARYNEDWNWLMPVVEKIESKGFDVFINTCNCIINDNGQGLFEDIEFTDNGGNKLLATYNAVVHFIQWYNDRKFRDEVAREE